MTETAPRATDTLIPQLWTVRIGDEDFRFATFSLAKTIRTFALLAEIAEKTGVSAAAGATSEGPAPGVFGRIVAALPKALREARDPLYQLLGLIVTSNKTLRELEEDGEDIEALLVKTGRRLANEGNNPQFVQLVSAAAEAIGVETIVQQIPNLTALFGK